MTRAVRWLVLAIVVAVIAIFRAQLFSVAGPGEAPRPLEPLVRRRMVERPIDVVLPVVPVGLERLRAGHDVLLVHYWAPWERHAARQIAELDSLRPTGVRAVVVCFDPFPSVARFVARRRVRSRVLIDGHRELRAALPCPSVPYTYVLDRGGRIAVAQPGEVDWLSARTRSTLDRLAGEPRENRHVEGASSRPAERHVLARAGPLPRLRDASSTPYTVLPSGGSGLDP